MLVLVLTAASAITPPAPKASAQAEATVRIERPVTINREEWEKLPEQARREVIVRDEQGHEILLRLIEQQ